ncbi:MAG: N-acetylmuramoyl-L-alanine amidase [Armatimonadota bacterium]
MTGRVPPRRYAGVAACAALLLAASLPAWSGTISRVTITPGSKQVTVSLVSSEGPIEIKGFTLANPPRLVFDLPGARLGADLPASIPLSLDGAKLLRLGQFSAQPDIARIVVDLTAGSEPPEWAARKGSKPGETLLVLGKGGPITLAAPVVNREADCVLVRLAGAGALRRSVGVLDNPYRIYADVQSAAADWYKTECDQAPLAGVRMGPQAPKDGEPVARVVVELRRKQAYSVFADGADLVIAVGPQPWALPLPTYVGAGRLRGKTIVVDAGHGGKDIGAPAGFGSPPSKPYEKNITLDIAQRLAAALKAEGASVTMTRKDDTFVALQARAAVANDLNADALISIHCNSCEAPNSLSGTSVYYDHPHSERFAALVQSELIAALGTVDKGVRNANFAVIRRTKGPGILVETAFINNDDDRERLEHPNFRERTARAIVEGLVEYLKERTKEASE